MFFGILGGLFGPSGKADETLLFATFFLVLPVLNGFADFLSWYASRRLGAHLLSCLGKVSRWRLFAWTIPSHIAVDVFIAVGLLACLALALPFVMQTISLARDFDYDVAGEIARAAQDPGGQGIWLTIMLFTTLIPTFLHLCMVAASPLSVCFLGEEKRQDWAAKLDRFHDEDYLRDNLPERDETASAVARWLTWGHDLRWAAAALAVALFIALIGFVFSQLHAGGLADLIAGAGYLGVDGANALFGG